MLARILIVVLLVSSDLAQALPPEARQALLNGLSEYLQRIHPNFSQIGIEERAGFDRGYAFTASARKSAWDKPFAIKNEVLERVHLEGKGSLVMTWQIETDTLKLVKHLASLPKSNFAELCPKDADTPFCTALNREMKALASATSYEEYIKKSPAKVREQTAELTDEELGTFRLAAESGKRVLTSTPELVKMHFQLDLLRADFMGSAWELQLSELERLAARKDTFANSALAKLFSEQLEKIEAWAFAR